MLAEINNYSRLGSFEEICYILKNVLSENMVHISDIHKYCLHNLKYVHIPIDGILSYLKLIGVIHENEDNVVLSNLGLEIIKNTNENDEIRRLLINRTVNIFMDGVIDNFIDYSKIKYDFSLGAYICSSSIPLKYSGLRNLLIDLGFFKVNLDNPDFLLLNKLYSKQIIDLVSITKRRTSLDELKRSLELKEQLGSKAEEFVIKFEYKRLFDHPNKESIVHVSLIDVNAGFDIASFNNTNSIMFDRFIEVKSYSKNIGFFWSKNEVEVAKLKYNNYYLYLVDRSKISSDTYKPIIIKNPYKEVFLSDLWLKDSQGWYINPIAY